MKSKRLKIGLIVLFLIVLFGSLAVYVYETVTLGPLTLDRNLASSGAQC